MVARTKNVICFKDKQIGKSCFFPKVEFASVEADYFICSNILVQIYLKFVIYWHFKDPHALPGTGGQ